jgi:hypothetical protein
VKVSEEQSRPPRVVFAGDAFLTPPPGPSPGSYSVAVPKMATKDRQGRTIETPTEARQAEPGPSVLALLTVSIALAVLILGMVWFVFFRI